MQQLRPDWRAGSRLFPADAMAMHDRDDEADYAIGRYSSQAMLRRPRKALPKQQKMASAKRANSQLM